MMSNFESFGFENIILIDRNINPMSNNAAGLSKDIQQTYATGVGLVCGGIIAVECIYPGFESRKRFTELVNDRGGVISPFAIKDSRNGTVWYLYRCAEEKSYLEPFSGYINVIGKGGIVPLPGDLYGRFEWLGATPETPEDLPAAMPWLFPNW